LFVLCRVALESTSSQTIPLREDILPSSLAYDWRGGHIFYTGFPGFQIELATINGNGIGSVLDFGSEKLYELNIIGELAFDSYTRYYYNPTRILLIITILYFSQHPLLDLCQ